MCRPQMRQRQVPGVCGLQASSARLGVCGVGALEMPAPDHLVRCGWRQHREHTHLQAEGVRWNCGSGSGDGGGGYGGGGGTGGGDCACLVHPVG